MLLSAFACIVALLAMSASAARPSVRYRVCVDICPQSSCGSSGDLVVRRANKARFRSGCIMTSSFSPDEKDRCCTFSTRQPVNAIRLSTPSSDDLGLSRVTVRADGDKIFEHEVFDREENFFYPYLWLDNGVINDQTFRFDYEGGHDWRNGQKRYRVDVTVADCSVCDSSAREMQVFFVDVDGDEDGTPSCELEENDGFQNGDRVNCVFTDNRRIGGICLGNSNTDGIGLREISVRDISQGQAAQMLFEYSADDIDSPSDWHTPIWVDGTISPKQHFRWFRTP